MHPGSSCGFGDGSWQLAKQTAAANQLQIPPGLSSSTEILSAATINIHEVPQGAGPSFPLPSRWQGEQLCSHGHFPAILGEAGGTATLTPGNDVLQKRCHSPQPPCLGDLSKPAHFISSVAPTLMRNAISIFPTCSFTPKKLPKEQGNRCSRWCTQGQSWVPKTSFSLVKKGSTTEKEKC